MIRDLFSAASPRVSWPHFLSLPRGQAAQVLLFLLFLLANSAYLHRVPGLLGDEASEGLNVFELLTADHLTIRGERSYIGPAIDYLRVPFVGLFGYSTLALRVPMLLVSVATFWLAWFVFRRLFDPEATTVALAVAFFSPTYLTYQRLGWAITLLPFFILLTLFFILQRERGASPLARQAPLLAGLSLGAGLATHILFLASLPSLLAGWFLRALRAPRTILSWWPAVIGFWAGFGSQFIILMTDREDQGNPWKVASLFWPHFRNLRLVLLDVLSGSSYVASYAGREFSPLAMRIIVGALVVLVAVALLGSRRKVTPWTWLLGLGIHLATLTVLMEYFSPRYFVVFVLGVWALAGVGAGVSVARVRRYFPRLAAWTPLIIAALLLATTVRTTLLPFLATGGSTAEFSVGKRTNTAAAFVDLRPLLACLAGTGPATSESIHIRNRLAYLELADLGIDLADRSRDARWNIIYRTPKTPSRSDERCRELAHFIVFPSKAASDQEKEALTH